MSDIFENVNTHNNLQKGTNNSKYYKWMRYLLKRSEKIGKVELPICSVILIQVRRMLIDY